MADIIKVEGVARAETQGSDLVVHLACTNKVAYPVRFTEKGARDAIYHLGRLLPIQLTGGAKTYSPFRVSASLTEDGQKAILFETDNADAIAIVLPDDGIRALQEQLVQLLSVPRSTSTH